MKNQSTTAFQRKIAETRNAAIAKAESLLAGDPKGENALQTYLEENSELIPCHFLLGGSVHFNVIFSKLAIDQNLKTDFAYITKTSVEWNVVLVEIESDSKEIFTQRKGKPVFSEAFNKAYDQVGHWKSYLNEEKDTFLKKIEPFLIPQNMKRRNPLEFKYILIIVRRNWNSSNGIYQSTLKQRMGNDLAILTYDSIRSWVDRQTLVSKKLILSHWEEGFRVKGPEVAQTSLFGHFGPDYIKIEGDIRQKFIDDGYEIENWEKGDLLKYNLRHARARLLKE